MRPIILSIIFMLLLVGIANSATYTCGTNGVNNSCTQAGLDMLIGSTSDGDTINIAVGTHDWSNGNYRNGVEITKRITISGGGTCPTCGDVAEPPENWDVILDNGETTNQIFRINVTSTGTAIVRITGIEFQGQNAFSYYPTPSYEFIEEEITNIAQYRIDNNHFDNESLNGDNASDIRLASLSYGLVDHNYFSHDHIQTHSVTVTRISSDEWNDIQSLPVYIPSGGYSWSEPTNFGSERFVFFEDNSWIFRCPSTVYVFSPTAIDGYLGSRIVARYNYFQNAQIVIHDISGGTGTRGGRALEEYENTFEWASGVCGISFAGATGIRSGTAVVYNNSATGYQNPFHFMQNRGSWPACDNINDYDGDGDGNYLPDGYPCLDQPGRGKASGYRILPSADVQDFSFEPIRFWNNTGSVAGGCTGSSEQGGMVCNKFAEYVVSERDYYYSTDDSAKLPGYTPYTYPHPVQNGEIANLPPEPPEDFRRVE